MVSASAAATLSQDPRFAPEVAAAIARRDAMTHEERMAEIDAICLSCLLWQASLIPWGGHDCEDERGCGCVFAREHGRLL